MSNELALKQLEKLYERLGQPQSGDDNIYLGKNFSKADLMRELDALAMVMMVKDNLSLVVERYVKEHQLGLEL